MKESTNWYHFVITTDTETLNIYQNGEKLDVDLIYGGKLQNVYTATDFIVLVYSKQKLTITTQSAFKVVLYQKW